ncbi:MAG TPA: amidohydrolase family protein [Opitutaceae bacterium]
MSQSTPPPPPNAVTNVPPDHDWLALAEVEEAIDPDLPIVDTHHHLGDRPGARYLVPDLMRDIRDGHNIIATVNVEGNHFFRTYGPPHLRTVGETEVLVSMTECREVGMTRVSAGIVGYADFFLGAAVEEVLDAHIELGRGRFVGIRQITIWDESEAVRMYQFFPKRPLSAGMMADAKFREGFATMAPRHLTFDATVFHTQLGECLDLARAFPDTRMILDHLGCVVRVGPYAGKDDEIFRRWKTDLTRIAELDNVYIKIGGLGMRMYGFDFRSRKAPPSSTELAELWKPFVETAIEIFGPNRAMFESNFPIDKGYFGYRTCWNALKRLTRGASENEKAALFADTAIRTYGLAL